MTSLLSSKQAARPVTSRRARRTFFSEGKSFSVLVMVAALLAMASTAAFAQSYPGCVGSVKHGDSVYCTCPGYPGGGPSCCTVYPNMCKAPPPPPPPTCYDGTKPTPTTPCKPPPPPRVNN